MALFFFLDATVNYFLQQHYGLPPDSAVVWQSIFNTTPIEVKEFFAHNLHEIGKAVFTFIVITGCTLFGLGRLSRVGLKEPMVSSRRWEAIVAVSTLIFIALHFNPTMRNANPVAYWPIRYLDYQENIAHFKHMQILMKNSAANMKAWMLQDKTELERTVVLVIGESANRDNWSLYGYQR
ncbi:phosphoethanolamine transferase, partial [Glaciimonas sp. GG7]